MGKPEKSPKLNTRHKMEKIYGNCATKKLKQFPINMRGKNTIVKTSTINRDNRNFHGCRSPRIRTIYLNHKGS